MDQSRFDLDPGLARGAANAVALSPISLVLRAGEVFPDRVAIIDGTVRRTWREVLLRTRRLAGALAQAGIGRGDVVAIIAPNTAPLVEAHYAVPMAGAVLCALNTRLDAASLRYMLGHARAKLFLVDADFAALAADALAGMDAPPRVIAVGGAGAPDAPGHRDAPDGHEALDAYEAFVASAEPATPCTPRDEWDAIALNYTSGTTGRPKGVVYHHRGAYLNAVSNVLSWDMPSGAVYLWTLPMFHCNGWCFPWTIAAVAGTHVCARGVDPEAILRAIDAHGVTHLCGAPIVFAMVLQAATGRPPFARTVRGMTAGASPPAAMIEAAERQNIAITHVYGLTETYGPAAVCAPHPHWADMPLPERAALIARQGVRGPLQDAMTVLDPQTLQPVPADGTTMGEVMFRGNIVMRGYLDDPDATAAAFAGGVFHTGDLAVVHPDGYVQVRDRAKDIIISGGENISSLAVEDALSRHPAVLAAAVVAMPDPKWGETPCAFVELRPGAEVDAAALQAHARAHLAGYMVPRTYVFGPLPRTSTGKVQKFELRARVRP